MVCNSDEKGMCGKAWILSGRGMGSYLVFYVDFSFMKKRISPYITAT